MESVVRTTDGGIYWRDVTPHVPPGQKIAGVVPVYSVDWLNSLTAWVATTLDTPTDTTVIFHTVDGGRTWRSVTTPLFGQIRFTNAREGWLLTGNDDVYRSTDCGETWIKVGSAKFFRQTIGITFVDTTTGWIAGFSDAKEGVYHLVTRDGGHTWQQQKLPLPFQVTAPGFLDIGGSHKFFNSQDGILPAAYGTNKDAGVFFYVTHDGGTTWTYTTPVTVQSYRAVSGILVPQDRSSSFADANHGWVTDGDTLYVTSDGGRHWATIQASPPFAHVGEIDFISPQVGWATGQALFLPVLLKTLDGGHTWAPVTYTISRQ